MAGCESPDCTIAIAQDSAGRHYFVSIDGARFRQVQHFPLGHTQAQALFELQRRPEKDRLDLVQQFGSRVSFMSVLG